VFIQEHSETQNLDQFGIRNLIEVFYEFGGPDQIKEPWCSFKPRKAK